MKGTHITRSDGNGMFQNPEDVARRMVKVFASHDNVEGVENWTLGTKFTDMGLDDLTKVECFLEIEREFDVQLPDEAVERFLNLREAVEYVARSFHTDA